MGILLDTCIYLWILEDSSRLTDAVRKRLDSEYPRYVSAVSFAEIEIKRSIGKLQIPENYRDRFVEIGLSHLDFSMEDSTPLTQLPFYHKDPFDRLLIAQGISRKLTIITADSVFKRYPAETIVC